MEIKDLIVSQDTEDARILSSLLLFLLTAQTTHQHVLIWLSKLHVATIMEMHVFHLHKSKGSSQNKHTPEQNKFFKEGTAEGTAEGTEAWRINTHIIQHMGEMQLQSK